MTNVQKTEVVNALAVAKEVLGSYNKVAAKCDVSPATISQMRNGVENPEKWELIKIELWQKVAMALNVRFTGWQIAETTNLRMMQQVLTDAKNECMFVMVSYPAGSGKTTGLDVFMAQKNSNAYYVKCRKWAERELLENLLPVIGIARPKGVVSLDRLRQIIIDFFKSKAHVKPTLFLDQTNSLRSSAINFLIDLFNEMEDQMSVVLVGTEALQKNIETGVRLNKTGYDEIESRFGRKYIKLIGSNYKDVAAICTVNGIEDTKLHKQIFDECKPVVKQLKVDGKNTVSMKVVEDHRRIKRAVKRELLKMNVYAAA